MEHVWNTHQCSILVLIYTLLLPEGEMRESRKPSREQCYFSHCGTLNINLLSGFSVLNGQTHLLVTEGAPRGLFTDKLICGHALLTGRVVTESIMQFQLLCTYNACAANSHTAADCSPSEPFIIKNNFQLSDRHARGTRCRHSATFTACQ